MPNSAVAVSIGPGDIELGRLHDLVESLACYEPALKYFVIVNDGNDGDVSGAISNLLPDCQVEILAHPRRGTGDWWCGGSNVATIAAFQAVARRGDADFVVRLDSDSLVIGPFADRIANRFQQEPRAGILGCFHLDPNQQRRDRYQRPEYMQQISRKLTLPLTIWRHSDWPTRWQCLLFRRDRRLAGAIRAARFNGWTPGEFVRGGGYAVSGVCLRRMLEAGYLNEPLDYLPIYFAEDHLATILCYAVQLSPFDFNAPGEVFGVMHRGLCLPPESLIDAGYAIIHSVKTHDGRSEEETRSFFGLRRCRS